LNSFLGNGWCFWKERFVDPIWDSGIKNHIMSKVDQATPGRTSLSPQRFWQFWFCFGFPCVLMSLEWLPLDWMGGTLDVFIGCSCRFRLNSVTD
jgi:hypothetical protein